MDIYGSSPFWMTNPKKFDRHTRRPQDTFMERMSELAARRRSLAAEHGITLPLPLRHERRIKEDMELTEAAKATLEPKKPGKGGTRRHNLRLEAPNRTINRALRA